MVNSRSLRKVAWPLPCAFGQLNWNFQILPVRSVIFWVQPDCGSCSGISLVATCSGVRHERTPLPPTVTPCLASTPSIIARCSGGRFFNWPSMNSMSGNGLPSTCMLLVVSSHNPGCSIWACTSGLLIPRANANSGRRIFMDERSWKKPANRAGLSLRRQIHLRVARRTGNVFC
ncbi:hypothetical protein D3C77_502930 [compost metagenome]